MRNWKNVHNITFRNVYGESASENEFLYNECLSKFANIIKEYFSGDVLCVDETEIFCNFLLDRTFILKEKICSGCKQSNERITIL